MYNAKCTEKCVLTMAVSACMYIHITEILLWCVCCAGGNGRRKLSGGSTGQLHEELHRQEDSTNWWSSTFGLR